jgi:hypothetical protein
MINPITSLIRIASLLDNKHHKICDKIDHIIFRLAQYYDYDGSLNGEWWLSNGQAMYADGDIGDTNHEGYVIDLILGQHDLDYDTLDALKMKAESEEEPRDIYEILETDYGFNTEEIEVVLGSTDARIYGLKHLGWQRVNGNSVQTQTLTSRDLANIANGLWDAYDEQCENAKFDIEVEANKRFYTGIPYSVISSEQPAQVMRYKNN